MNISLIFDLVIAFGVQLFTSQGQDDVVDVLKKLKGAKDAGANVDAHLAAVAHALETGEPLDWEALDALIDAEVAEFLER